MMMMVEDDAGLKTMPGEDDAGSTSPCEKGPSPCGKPDHILPKVLGHGHKTRQRCHWVGNSNFHNILRGREHHKMNTRTNIKLVRRPLFYAR